MIIEIRLTALCESMLKCRPLSIVCFSSRLSFKVHIVKYVSLVGCHFLNPLWQYCSTYAMPTPSVISPFFLLMRFIRQICNFSTNAERFCLGSCHISPRGGSDRCGRKQRVSFNRKSPLFFLLSFWPGPPGPLWPPAVW